MTPEEIKRRRLAYPLSTDELAKRIGVSPQAVRSWERGDRAPYSYHLSRLEALFAKRDGCRCGCHGGAALSRTGVPPWSTQESDRLRQLVDEGLDPDAVADTLAAEFGHRRTRSAINDRANRLGLTFMLAYSSDRARLALGVTKHRIYQWITTGVLPAQRHVGVDSGKSTPWWRITQADLEAFVERYAGTLIEPARIRDATLRERADAARISREGATL